MLKQVLLVILLSTIAVFFVQQLSLVLHFIAGLHHVLAQKLGLIFAGGKIGYLVRQVISIVLPALLLAVLVELVLRCFKKEGTSAAIYTLWMVWCVLIVVIGLR